jgi:DNA topoisomerase-1
LVKDGQSAFRANLRLPRRTQYLSREERGLIALLESATPPDTVQAA